MPWNKYPNREREKNFRLGNGFSKMLNILNIDFNSQIDAIKDNAYESDNEEINNSENKLNKRRMSKNLSSANINSKSINTTNNKNLLPKISNINNKVDNFIIIYQWILMLEGLDLLMNLVESIMTMKD